MSTGGEAEDKRLSYVSTGKERVSGRSDWSTLYIFKGQRV